MKRIVSLLLLAVCATIVCAKEPQRPTSYNYQRGVEAVNNDNDEEGEKYLEKEIAENPKNGYAHAWLAAIEWRKDEAGNAIYYLNKALKYIPKTDKYYHAWCYSTLATITLNFNDTIKAIDYMSKAIKAQPDNMDWLVDRGVYYIEYKQYELALADFEKVIKHEPTIVRGYMWKGKTYYLLKKYEQAIEQYQYANKLATRSFIYSHIAECEIALQRYEEAASNIINALKEEHFEDLATDLLADANEELSAELMPRINVQINANPNSLEWYMYKLYLYRTNKNYEQAIKCTEKIKELDADPYFDAVLSTLYYNMGDFASALHYAHVAYASDTTETDYMEQLTNAYSALDSLEKCIEVYDAYIAQYPESEAAYHMRAQTHFFAGNYTSAIDDYTTAITLDQKDTYARYMRGRTHYIIGDTIKATKDFHRVVEDTKNSIETAFAYIFLGRNEEAKQLADSILLGDSVDHEHRYNIACCYSLLGETNLAFTLLEEELTDGYAEFNHIRRDPDFDPLRGERLDSLLIIYETKVQERVRAFKGEDSSESTTERIVEIPFTKSGGVTKVDCTINNLPLNFIFDTGASDVTISQVEANFMYKNGYLDARDVVGKKTYQVATGAIAVGTTIILKEIEFGGLILRDVRASVVETQNAPLLLGQTVLQRLGKIEIDNTQRILKITTNQ